VLQRLGGLKEGVDLLRGVLGDLGNSLGNVVPEVPKTDLGDRNLLDLLSGLLLGLLLRSLASLLLAAGGGGLGVALQSQLVLGSSLRELGEGGEAGEPLASNLIRNKSGLELLGEGDLAPDHNICQGVHLSKEEVLLAQGLLELEETALRKVGRGDIVDPVVDLVGRRRGRLVGGLAKRPGKESGEVVVSRDED